MCARSRARAVALSHNFLTILFRVPFWPYSTHIHSTLVCGPRSLARIRFSLAGLDNYYFIEQFSHSVMKLSGVLRELSEWLRCRMHDNYKVHADNDKRLAELFLSLISKFCQFTPNLRVISSNTEREDEWKPAICEQCSSFWRIQGCDRNLLVLKHLIVCRCAVEMGVRCCRRWATPSRLW